MNGRIFVIALGGLAESVVAASVREHFGPVQMTWLDRNALRREPLKTLAGILTRPYEDAVLVVADLDSPRVRLTSLLLCLPRASRRWRIDLRGTPRQPWRLSDHLTCHLLPMLRHLAGFGLALAAGEPLLSLTERLITRGGGARLSARARARGPSGGRPGGETCDPPSEGVQDSVARGSAVPASGEREPAEQASTARARVVSTYADAHRTVSDDAEVPDATPPPRRAATPAQALLQPDVARREFESLRLLYLRSQLWLGLAGGGSVAHTAGVIGGLEESGVQVDVVSSDRLAGVQAPTTLAMPETWFDGWRREVEDLVYNVAFFQAALRVARRVRPQVLYQRHTAFNCAGAVLSWYLHLPLVLEFNSSELWKGRYWGGLRLVRAAARVERINLRAADLVIVISDTLGRQLEAAGVPREKIVVNPNGVDPSQFHSYIDASALRARLGVQPGDTVVGFSGTFGEWHGIPTLAQALPRVLEMRRSVRWLLIGDGPLRRLIEDAVHDYGLGQRVLLPGFVPHAQMPEYLAACDVLVSPHGRQADGGEFFGSPTKLYEYMAMGKPIVASGVGQIAEVLDNETSALLVEPDDPTALSNAIVRLVDDGCLRARLGRAARAAAVERHTWRHNAERLLSALAEASAR